MTTYNIDWSKKSTKSNTLLDSYRLRYTPVEVIPSHPGQTFDLFHFKTFNTISIQLLNNFRILNFLLLISSILTTRVIRPLIRIKHVRPPCPTLSTLTPRSFSAELRQVDGVDEVPAAAETRLGTRRRREMQ